MDNKAEIINDPVAFRETFLKQVMPSRFDVMYLAILKVVLYSIWRGCVESISALKRNVVQPDLGLLCLSTYKAFLPILQCLRLGHQSDAVILARSLMERIAIVGYLNEYPEKIERYTRSKNDVTERAMIWAKSNGPENWMRLYSAASSVTHSKLVGVAGHIYADNSIGDAIRDALNPPLESQLLYDEIIGIILYALIAIDPIAVKLLKKKQSLILPTDYHTIKAVDVEDVREFQKFMNALVV